MASAIFLTVSTGVVGLVSSSITSHSTSRERTRAEEIAQAQIEKIRTMPYANVGVTNGNPPGTLSASGFSGSVPSGYSATIDVDYVADPSASSYTLSANYKKVTVTITRTRDSRRLAKLTTNVAPTTRSSLGGIAGVSLTVKVKDWALPVGDSSSNVESASVTLSNGPDPSRTDVTDSLGELAFLAVTPTNSSAPGNFYDLAVTKSGYVTYPSDISPASAAHMALAPSQVASTTIRLFKPATLTVALKDGSNPYTGAATVKVYSAKTAAWTTHTVNNATGTLTLTSIGGDYVYPNVLYTVYAYTSSGLCSSEVEQNVPDDYPSVLDSTINLPLTACPSGGLNVNVKQLGANVSGATITVSGGPNSVSQPTAPTTWTTDASGNLSVTGLPSGASTYTVTASKTIQGVTYTTTGTATVTTSGTTAVNLTLNSPATATVNVTVTAGGSAVSGATVSLTNSPFGLTFSDQTTNGSGVATFTNVPVGTGYAVSATKSGVSQSNTSLAVTSPTTSTSLALPTGSLTVTAEQYGTGAASASVTVSGGPFSTTQSATANASGVTTFSNLVAGGGYSVSATKSGQTGTATGITIVTSPTATQTVTIPNPPNGDMTVNVKWVTLNQNGASVRLSNTSLGYDTTQTTNTSGNTTFTSVPSGSGYTLTATKLGATVTSTGVTIAASPTANSANLVLPTGTQAVSVTMGGANVSGASVTLSQSSVPYTSTQTTTSTGTVTFSTVPAATGLTASATAYGQTVSNTSVTVAASPASNTTVALVIPSGTVATNVKWAGANQSGVTVTVANASIGFTKSGTTDGSGNVSLSGIPVATGYTVTATHSSGQTASQSSVSVTNGATTSVNLTLPTVSQTINVVRNGSVLNSSNGGGSVTISGGPASIGTVSGTTDASGNVTFTNLPVGGSYTLKAWRTSCSGSTNKSITVTNQTVSSPSSTINLVTNSTTCPP